eukprot:2375787-Prymnesium_polylepis.1
MGRPSHSDASRGHGTVGVTQSGGTGIEHGVQYDISYNMCVGYVCAWYDATPDTLDVYGNSRARVLARRACADFCPSLLSTPR